MKLKLCLFIKIRAKLKKLFQRKKLWNNIAIYTPAKPFWSVEIYFTNTLSQKHMHPPPDIILRENSNFSASSYFQLTYFITQHSPEAHKHFQLLQQSICEAKGMEIQRCTWRCYQVWLGWNRGAASPVPQPPAELMHLQMCPPGEILQVGPLGSPPWSSSCPLALQQKWGCPPHSEQKR